MQKIRVGVVRGGISNEYDVSLKTGGQVLAVLREKLSDKYIPNDILIARDGTWHINGVPTNIHNLLGSVDVIFNALHGEYGEDGRIQSELEHAGIPYTGSGPHASEKAMNKSLAKEALKNSTIRTPKHIEIHWGSTTDDDQTLAHLAHKMAPAPWIIKPISGGSSIGIRLTKSFPDLVSAIAQARDAHVDVLIEEFIVGREATVGIVEGLRDTEYYHLLPIEIKKSKNGIWNYENKYDNSVEEVCPGNFSKEEKEQLLQATETIHRILGLRHYSRADFIITPRSIVMLEVNTLPGLTENSLFPKALTATGVSQSEFIDHLLSLAYLEKN